MGKSFYIILLDKVLFGPLFKFKIVSRFPQLIVGGIKVAIQLLKFLIVVQHVFQCSFLFYFGFIMSILICSFFFVKSNLHTYEFGVVYVTTVDYIFEFGNDDIMYCQQFS